MELVGPGGYREGSALARSVWGAKGRLASAGDKLDASLIRRLTDEKVPFVWLDEGHIETCPAIDAQLEDRLVELLVKAAQIARGGAGQSEQLLECASEIPTLSQLVAAQLMARKKDQLDFMPVSMASVADYYPVERLVLVALYGGWLGLDARLQPSDLAAVITACLLSDWHLMTVDWETAQHYRAPWGQTSEDFKSHPRLMFELLQQARSISALAAAAILSHHERYDGKGFPKGRAADQIYPLGQFVAAADLLALGVCGELATEGVTPSQFNDYISLQAGLCLSPKLAQRAAQLFPPACRGAHVELSDGRQAIVEQPTPGLPSRPVVRITGEDKSLALADQPNLLIDRILLPCWVAVNTG